MAESKWVSLIL